MVALVAEGLSNEEIAARWYVSQATVRTHVSRAMTKLAARDRAQLVVFAYRNAVGDDPDRLSVFRPRSFSGGLTMRSAAVVRRGSVGGSGGR